MKCTKGQWRGAVEMKKNKKKKKLFFGGVILLVFGALLVKQQTIINRLNKQYAGYETQKIRVEREKEELTEKLKLTERPDYIEDSARQKLGLIKPNEILIKDTSKKR